MTDHEEPTGRIRSVYRFSWQRLRFELVVEMEFKYTEIVSYGAPAFVSTEYYWR